MLKNIYEPIQHEEEFVIDHNNPLNDIIKAAKLKGTNKFSLIGKRPVITEIPGGFRFQLNYLNYLPMVPNLDVIAGEQAKNNTLKVRQYYSKTAKLGQYYWFSVFFAAFLLLLLFTSLGVVLDYIEFKTLKVGVLVPIAMCLFSYFAVRLGISKRTKMWRDSKVQLVELLKTI